MWRLRVQTLDVRHCATVVLLNLDGKLGDAIIQSCLVREIRNVSTTCRIVVITTASLLSYWRTCDGVTIVYNVLSRDEAPTWKRAHGLINLTKSAKLQRSDVVLSFDPIPMIDYFLFVRYCRPRFAMGLSVTQYSIFHCSVNDPILELPRKHVGHRIVRALAALGLPVKLEELRGITPHTVATQGQDGSRRLFLNGYGASDSRTFSPEQLSALALHVVSKYSDVVILLNLNSVQRGTPDIVSLCSKYPKRVNLFSLGATIDSLFEAVANSDAVLTPDTGVAHVAAATATPLVVVYDDVAFNPICWAPLTTQATCIIPDEWTPISQVPVSKLIQFVDDALS